MSGWVQPTSAIGHHFVACFADDKPGRADDFQKGAMQFIDEIRRAARAPVRPLRDKEYRGLAQLPHAEPHGLHNQRSPERRRWPSPRTGEDNLYGGVRVRLTASLEGARIPLQIDVGFGDAITPPPVEADFPVSLDFPAPHLRMYPPEATIAEKLHALVIRDIGNSRMKDLFDLHMLGRRFPFTAERLGGAIAATFDRRLSLLPEDMPTVLTRVFSDDDAKQAQWSAFLRRQHLTAEALPLADVISFLADFLLILGAVQGQKPVRGDWPAGGPWRHLSASGEEP